MSEFHSNARQKSKLRLVERRENARLRRLESKRINASKPKPLLEHGQFKKIPLLIPNINSISKRYIDIVTQQGNIPTSYGGQSWHISRNYIDNSKIISPELEPIFQPILQLVQDQVETDMQQKVELDSACGHLYDADTPNVETGSSWAEHRDYQSNDSLALTSVVVQGATPEGFEGGGLTMRVGDTKTFVQLAPGDALVLHKTWHLPHTITRGRRLVFVLFFRKKSVATKEMSLNTGETKTSLPPPTTTTTTRTTTRTRAPPIHSSTLTKGYDANDNKTCNEYTLLHLIHRGTYGKVKHALKFNNPSNISNTVSNTTSNTTSNNTKYAVKIYSKQLLKKKSLSRSKAPSPYENVLHEIQIMSQLNHSNIVQLIEIIDDENYDKMYLITEWIDNGASMIWNPDTSMFYYQSKNASTSNSTSTSINRISFYTEDTTRIALVQLSSALLYLHALNVVHHDIKPANVLRQDKYGGENSDTTSHVRFVLCDFGAASEYKSKTVQIVQTKGTHAFFSPEMCVGVEDDDDDATTEQTNQGKHNQKACNAFIPSNEIGFSPFQSDLWALGVTMYVYIYGKLPFWDGRGGQSLFNMIVNDEMDVPRRHRTSRTIKDENGNENDNDDVESILSIGIRELIHKMLNKNVQERLTLNEIRKDSWVIDTEGTTEMERKQDVAIDRQDVVSF